MSEGDILQALLKKAANYKKYHKKNQKTRPIFQ